LLTLFFKTGQSSCENVGRRLAEAALAFAVEIDGRGMQGKQHRRRFDRRGVVSVVITGKIQKRKFAIADALPEEIGLDLFGQRRRLLQQVAAEGFSKRNSTVAALILLRLPEGISTCKELSLSAMTVPALKPPSSSNNTFIGGL
jgi:hypothetical protein